MTRSGWFALFLGAGLGALASVLAGNLLAIFFLVPAGALIGAFLHYRIERVFQARTNRLVEEALGVLERFSESFGSDRWYVDPQEGLEGAATRFDAALDRIAARVGGLIGEEGFLLDLLAYLDAGVIRLDDRHRIDLFSGKAAALFRTTAPAVQGKPLLTLPGLLPVEGVLESSLADGTSRTVEVDGPDDRRIEIRVVPPVGGRGTLLILKDVSEMRRLETSRTEMVANISHELRTPVTSIKGFTETLLDPAVGPEERDRFLRVMAREAERLSAILDDLLDLSSLEARRSPPQLRQADGARLVRELAEGAEATLRQKGLTLQVQAPDALPLETDPGRIHEILMNLIDNAQKYTPPGGQVTIGVRDEGESVVFTVSDTGRGIPHEDLPRIFERFYRVDRARSRASGGTGLGLAIAKHLAESLGAALDVQSETGHGTTFTLSLMKEGGRA